MFADKPVQVLNGVRAILNREIFPMSFFHPSIGFHIDHHHAGDIVPPIL